MRYPLITFLAKFIPGINGFGVSHFIIVLHSGAVGCTVNLFPGCTDIDSRFIQFLLAYRGFIGWGIALVLAFAGGETNAQCDTQHDAQ